MSETSAAHAHPKLEQKILPASQPNVYPDVPILAEAKEIRLIRLLPGTTDQRLSCQLIVSSLAIGREDSATYEALSYVWGPFSNKTIVLNGLDGYIVTDNLAAALMRLRKTNEPRLLWTDAICINQNDTAERSSQVTLMRRIYTIAIGIIISRFAQNEDLECDDTRIRAIAERDRDLQSQRGNLEHRRLDLNDYKLVLGQCD